MSLAIAAKIARREMRGGIRGFRIFLACLALGIAAIAAIGSVREGIQTGLESQGATLLGGDAEIQLTYRFADADEREWMAENSDAVSEIVDFRSMATVGTAGQGQQALTQVKAVDATYPLFGIVELENDVGLLAALSGADGLPGAVMDPILVDRLSLSIGSVFRLGTQEFILSGVLKYEPDGAAGFSLGPRTIVRRADLTASGLLTAGTLFQSAYRMKLSAGVDLIDMKGAAEQAIQGGGFRWRDRRNGAPGAAAFVDRLSTFLVLVGLAGLIVGGVGVSAAVRAYLAEKTTVIATLKSTGAGSLLIFQIYLIQIGAMAVLGILLGLVLGAIIPIAIAPILNANLPIPAVTGIFPEPLFQALIYGLLVAILFSLWPLSNSARTKVAALFRDADFGVPGFPDWPTALASGLLLVVLIGLSAAFTGHTKLVLWAAFGLFVAFLALTGAGLLVRVLARWLARRRFVRNFTPLHLAMGSVAGPSREVSSVVLSLGLGLCVLAAIGQIDTNLQGAISQELPDKAPAFFVLDIQESQVDQYMQRLETDPGVSRIENAPMLRGLITEINGDPAGETAGDHWVIRGDRGLTYAALPPARGAVTAGEWWPENYAGPPQISFAATEAGEIGLSLGDTMTVNILGRPITATITSFRDVDFSSAGMGFVVTLNPAALAGAPHSFISTIYAEPDAEVAIMRDLTGQFPNITLINVREAIERVGGVLQAVAAAITYGALATLATGLVVMIGTAAVGERARSYEAAILKTLGASRRTILFSFLLRSLILGLASGAVAVLAGGLAAWAVLTLVMEVDFDFSVVSALLVVGTGIFVAGVAGIGFSLKSLNAPAAATLRARE